MRALQPCYWAIRFVSMHPKTAKELYGIKHASLVVVVGHKMPHAEAVEHTGGGESKKHVKKQLCVEATFMAKRNCETPSSMVPDAITKNKNTLRPK